MVLKEVVHYGKVELYSLPVFLDSDLVKTIETGNKRLRIAAEVYMVVLEHGTELLKLSCGYRLEHELAVLCVVEERATLAAGAELDKCLHVIAPHVAEDVFRT